MEVLILILFVIIGSSLAFWIFLSYAEMFQLKDINMELLDEEKIEEYLTFKGRKIHKSKKVVRNIFLVSFILLFLVIALFGENTAKI